MDMNAMMQAAVANAQAAVAAATAQKAAADKQAAQNWEQKAELIEEALEHAGISGVDAQIDGSGFARLVGQVDSEENMHTALKIAEQFDLNGLESNLEVVEPEPIAADENAMGGGDGVTYTTVKGDSWWRIAATFYGDGTVWKQLKRANGWPKMLHPNVELKIPAKADLAKWKE